MDMKQPTTYRQQIEILKSRGCVIEDDLFAEKVLSAVNYYRFTAYFLPYKESDNQYKEGTAFNTIFQIYEFDRELRSLLFSTIEEIEVYLRARLAYYFAHKYGALGYENPLNFSAKHNQERFETHVNSMIHQNNSKDFVRHHIEKYESKFPIWAIIELFTFGNLSLFYADMLTADKKEFARNSFNTFYDCLESWLVCLTDLRNNCAHYSRLYYTQTRALPKTPKNYPVTIGRSVFDQILVLKFVYQDKEKWNRVFIPRLSTLIDKYSTQIDLKHIGFPENWLSILKNELVQ